MANKCHAALVSLSSLTAFPGRAVAEALSIPFVVPFPRLSHRDTAFINLLFLLLLLLGLIKPRLPEDDDDDDDDNDEAHLADEGAAEVRAEEGGRPALIRTSQRK